jgi:hypothetical protein
LSSSPILADENEPIAYIGHGAFFDHTGRQITPTYEFLDKAQDWYRAKLLSSLNANKKAEFADFERRLNDGLRAEGQARLVIQQRLLDWLVANSPQLLTGDRQTLGKLNALASRLKWKLPEPGRQNRSDEKFKLDPELENKLNLPAFKAGSMNVLFATTNVGQQYINECMAAGVPIPPPINRMDPAGLAGWKIEGTIPPLKQFIVGGLSPAEVRTYQSFAPRGMCIALPRFTNASKGTVRLDGVICLGQSSKVCFWDNQMGGIGFDFPAGTQIPIGVPDLSINSDTPPKYQAGGYELLGGSGGVCTDCHAGQNPYIIHPMIDLGNGRLMGSLGLPTFAPSRYDPLVPAEWPQNQRSHVANLPGVCSNCHNTFGGPGGAFPRLSLELQGYCGTIMQDAINRDPNNPTRDPTMPMGSPGSAAGTQAIRNLLYWCGQPASAKDILFYRNDGVAAVGHVQNGQFQQTQSITSFTGGWTHIVPIGDQILFVKNDGVAAVGHIQNGQFQQTQSIAGFTGNWTHIVPIEDQILFVKNDGVAAVGHIQNGQFQQTWSTTGFTGDWSKIMAVGQ